MSVQVAFYTVQSCICNFETSGCFYSMPHFVYDSHKSISIYINQRFCPVLSGSFVRLRETEAGWSTWLGSGFTRQSTTDTEIGSMAPTSSERPWDRGNPWRYVSVASGQNHIGSLFTSLIISITCTLSLISTSIQYLHHPFSALYHIFT